MTDLPARYRKRPIPVEARQVPPSEDGSAGLELAVWCGGSVSGTYDSPRIFVPTLEGDLVARVGDWIVKGPRGEFWPVKGAIFAEYYEAADVEPAALRDRIAAALDAAFEAFDPEATEEAQLSGHLADAVLAVLPAPADRGAVLNEAADRLAAKYSADDPAVEDMRLWAAEARGNDKQDDAWDVPDARPGTTDHTLTQRPAARIVNPQTGTGLANGANWPAAVVRAAEPADTQTAEVQHAPGKAIRCPDCRDKGHTVCMDAKAQQDGEAGPTVPTCDGCGHLVHRARKCPALRYGERCECDEPLDTDGEG